MNITAKAAAAAACLAVAVAPAVATASKPDQPGSKGQEKAQQKSQKPSSAPSQGSKRCKKPTVSKGFVASGTYTSWTGVKDNPADPKSTYSGTLTVAVARTNHHAKNATSPFTFSQAKVRFDSPTATGPVAGDKVKLIGKIVVAKKKCSTQAAAATPAPGTYTIAKIVFSAPSSD